MHPPRAPEQDLLDRLSGCPGRGTFEAHVTVEAPDPPARERFRALCEELGVKCVLIELPEGATTSQPMTSSYHRGGLPDVAKEVAGITTQLRAAGFDVTRVKLEAVVTNEGVPDTEEEVRRFPPGNYFEFHVKVSLPLGTDLRPLRELSARSGAHLSRNALKRDSAGAQRFVTLRVYGEGRSRANARFEALLRELETGGYSLSNRLREYTLYDSNSSVDSGWSDPPPGVGNAGGGGAP